MARINIEDSLFKDSRWFKLLIKVGCEHKALGLITNAWILAQTNWLKYKCIPDSSWKKDLDILIEVDFAEKIENGVYIKGSVDAFSWLEQRSNSGKSKSDRKIKSLKQNTKNVRTTAERLPNGCRTATEPLTHSLTPSLTLTTNTNTIVENEQVVSTPQEITKVKRAKTGEVKFAKESQIIKVLYGDSFFKRYGSLPAWGAKENRLANLLIDSVGVEMATKLAEFYPTYADPWHVNMRHDFGLLVSQKTKVMTDMQNVKHLVDATIHKKTFDDNVEDFQHKVKSEELRLKAELSVLAFEWAKKEMPFIRDYEFEYEKFLESKNISPKLPYPQLKEIILGRGQKEITA